MWPFSKKKENLPGKARKFAKEGKEKAIKEAIEFLIKRIMIYAKRGKSSVSEPIEEDIREEVLELIQKEGFDAELERRYIWWIHISW